MLLKLDPHISSVHLKGLLSLLRSMSVNPVVNDIQNPTAINLIGTPIQTDFLNNLLKRYPEVTQIEQDLPSFKMASKFFKEKTRISVGKEVVGGDDFTLIAGPCSAESKQQVEEITSFLKEQGLCFMRGGAFKPRSSPYSFQGVGVKGLEWLKESAERHSMSVISEVMDVEHLPVIREFVDVLQVGSRNMQNFPLLKALGR